MPSNKSRRPPLTASLTWFLPALAMIAIAVFVSHPLALVPLLLANALTLGAVCHAIGFDPEPSFTRTVLRRGAAQLVLFSAYTALVLLLVAWPLVTLMNAPSLGAALLLSVALAASLAALWRIWPAFALTFLWDDAFPAQGQGSWIFTALARSLAFARHLSAEEHFFTHFLPASLVLLVDAFGALALSGLYGVVPDELRTAAVLLYGLLLLPLGGLVLANRTLRAMLCEGRRARRETRAASTEPEPEPQRERSGGLGDAPTLSPQETRPGAREDALLQAVRDGDVARALALLEAGAEPDVCPPADDRDQRSTLQRAALLPDTRLLRAMIARGADVNRLHCGLTPLLAATRDSYHGRPEAVMTLLANGADPRVADAEGNTALHGAALSAEPTVAAMLLDAEAPLEALNRTGLTPLAAACRAANWPLARFLLEHGARARAETGEPPLIAAASIAEDDPEGVRLLLRHKAQPNAVNALGRTALMQAALEGHAAIAAALIAAGTDVDLADRNGSTALMEAARAGADAVVQALAAAGADAAPRDAHGRDALMLACQSPRARIDTVRSLLQLGADPRSAGDDGRSALDHAAATGRWDLVALLDPESPLPTSLGAGAEPEAGADTPAHLADALRFGHWAIASTFATRAREWPQATLAALYLDLAAPELTSARHWLLEHGLDAEARLEDGTRLFDALLERLPQAAPALRSLRQSGASPAGAGRLARALAAAGTDTAAVASLGEWLDAGADAFGADTGGRTPLHLAASGGHVPLARALLERGADPNARDGDGRTPLHAALGAADAESTRAIVRLLLAHGADPEAAAANSETPLGEAVARGDLELQRWLRWNDRWRLPRRRLRAEDLPAAAAAGDAEAVARLLELEFPVDTRDERGASALLRACGGGHGDVARRLLEAGADPAQTAASGVTPLAAAVSARQGTMIALLLERGAQVDQRLPGEATALMVAAAVGHADIVEQLLQAGADLGARDQRGRGALHAAARFCFESRDSLRARRLLDALLRSGGDANPADAGGLTPLLLLLGAHAKPGAECDATHIGALLPVLLDAGADIAHADARGVTALHACAMHALLAPARMLLARGAPRGAADGFGRTAADVARLLGFVDVAVEMDARNGAVPSVSQTLRQPASE